MTGVNQSGEPVSDEFVWGVAELSDSEKDDVLNMLLGHLGLDLYRTNATKHGNTELELRPKD